MEGRADYLVFHSPGTGEQSTDICCIEQSSCEIRGSHFLLGNTAFQEKGAY